MHSNPALTPFTTGEYEASRRLARAIILRRKGVTGMTDGGEEKGAEKNPSLSTPEES